MWNFAKFLVKADGTVLHYYEPATDPDSFSDEIKKQLDM